MNSKDGQGHSVYITVIFLFYEVQPYAVKTETNKL